MRRGGFTFLELLLAGAILATVSFGALIGTIRISGLIDQRGELMAADGYCWDLAWRLYSDYDTLARWVTGSECDMEMPDNGYMEVIGEARPYSDSSKARGCEFLRYLSVSGEPVTCYLTLSNEWDSANQKFREGIYISINLEWGPEGQRRILTKRSDTPDSTIVYDHPIELFCSPYSSRSQGL